MSARPNDQDPVSALAMLAIYIFGLTVGFLLCWGIFVR